MIYIGERNNARMIRSTRFRYSANGDESNPQCKKKTETTLDCEDKDEEFCFFLDKDECFFELIYDVYCRRTCGTC